MSGNPQFPVPPPDLRALLDAFRQEIFSSLNCHQWGIIQGFSQAKQTATVQLAIQRLVPQDVGGQASYVAKTYPLLVDVPVMIPSGGVGYVSFPIAAGDTCLVLFNDRDYDQFFATSNIGPPNSLRLHDLSDGLAIVGFRTAGNPIEGYDGGQTVLAWNATKVVLGPKVGIGNDNTSLLTVLTNWINVLKAWVDTRGDTPNPATLAALNAIQIQINSLLQ